MSTALFSWFAHCPSSPAKETAERRLGRGRKDPATTTGLRFCDCWDGAMALRAKIRAPEPVGTTVDVGGEGGGAGLLWAHAACLRSLWRLQRNDPGWFVGEHMQERRLFTVTADAGDGDESVTDLVGERATMAAESFTRLGEAEP